MKPNLFFTTSFLALGFIFAACEKPSQIAEPLSSDSKSRIESQPFNGEVYRRSDDRISLTLISHDECELRFFEQIFLCKYTRQTDSLRVVGAFEANRVLYFRFIDQGVLQDNGAQILLSPRYYAAEIENRRLAQERDQKARESAERQRMENENRNRLESARMAALIDASKKETKVLGTFTCVNPGYEVLRNYNSFSVLQVTVTDAGLKLKFALAEHHGPPGDVVNFADLASSNWNERSAVTTIGTNSFEITLRFREGLFPAVAQSFHFGSRKEMETFIKVFDGAVADWDRKFPEIKRGKQ